MKRWVGTAGIVFFGWIGVSHAEGKSASPPPPPSDVLRVPTANGPAAPSSPPQASAPSRAGQTVCPATTTTYRAQSTVGIAGHGVRCVSSDNKAWIGLGYWREPTRGKYMHLGRLTETSTKGATGRFVDVTWTEWNAKTCSFDQGGAPNEVAITLEKTAPSSVAGPLADTLVVRELNERWTRVPDGVVPFEWVIPIVPLEQCQARFTVSFANGGTGVGCMLASTSDPRTSEPLVWLASETTQTASGPQQAYSLGWSAASNLYSRSVMCLTGDARCKASLESFSFTSVIQRSDSPPSIVRGTGRGDRWTFGGLAPFAPPRPPCALRPTVQ